MPETPGHANSSQVDSKDHITQPVFSAFPRPLHWTVGDMSDLLQFTFTIQVLSVDCFLGHGPAGANLTLECEERQLMWKITLGNTSKFTSRHWTRMGQATGQQRMHYQACYC